MAGFFTGSFQHSLALQDEATDKIKKRLQQEQQTNKDLLQQARDRHSSNALILDSIGEGVYGVDHNGSTRFVNRAVLSYTGFNEDELLRQNQHALLHHSRKDESPYPIEACPVQKTCLDGKIRNVTGEVFWRKDGSSFPVEYIVTPTVEVQGSYGAVVIFRDISRRLLTEEHLATSEEQFRTLFDTSIDAILIMDEQGHITKANPATYRLLCCQNEKQLLGKTLNDFSPPKQSGGALPTEALQKMLTDSLNFGSSFSEWRLRREDLQEIDVAVLLARMDLGKSVFIQANIRDIGEQKNNAQ